MKQERQTLVIRKQLMAPFSKVLSGQQIGNYEMNPTDDTRRVLSQTFPKYQARDLTIRIIPWCRLQQVHCEFKSK
jgi:hypothetical protein